MHIGFIGLGRMGRAICTHLLATGHELSVWNRSSEATRELAAKGARAVSEPAGAARADVLMIMLADDAAVRAVLVEQGVLAAAGASSVHVNLSTVSVALARELAELYSQQGAGFLAAPVFGRPDAAAAGKLHVVVAGASATIERARPALAAIGQKVWPVGERPELANAVKLAGNFMLASAIEAMGEAVALTRAHGVPGGAFLDILTNTLFACPAYQGYGAMIAAQRYEPAGFATPLALKDLRLALAAGEATRVSMPFASVLRDHLLELIATGGQDKDWSALAQLAARRAGLAHEGAAQE